MDKFGIFKLLNSFLDFYKANPTAFSNKNQPSIPVQEKSVSVNSQSQPLAPLKDKMLKTALDHEQIIKRVMQANNQNPTQK